MKLMFCSSCNSVFNLSYKLKSCDCGEVKGKYMDNVNAVTNGKGHTLAIGNGSLMKAVLSVELTKDLQDWRDIPNWKEWYNSRPGDNLFLAWVRKANGPSNPHSKVDPNL